MWLDHGLDRKHAVVNMITSAVLWNMLKTSNDIFWLAAVVCDAGDMAAPLASAKAGGSTVAPDFEAAAGTMDTCFGKENLGDSSVKLR